MAPKWVRQVIKESPIEPFSLHAFIMGDVTERTEVFIYRVGPDESHQSEKKKNQNKHSHSMFHRFTSSAKLLFLPSSCYIFSNNTDQQKLYEPPCKPHNLLYTFSNDAHVPL